MEIDHIVPSGDFPAAPEDPVIRHGRLVFNPGANQSACSVAATALNGHTSLLRRTMLRLSPFHFKTTIPLSDDSHLTCYVNTGSVAHQLNISRRKANRLRRRGLFANIVHTYNHLSDHCQSDKPDSLPIDKEELLASLVQTHLKTGAVVSLTHDDGRTFIAECYPIPGSGPSYHLFEQGDRLGSGTYKNVEACEVLFTQSMTNLHPGDSIAVKSTTDSPRAVEDLSREAIVLIRLNPDGDAIGIQRPPYLTCIQGKKGRSWAPRADGNLIKYAQEHYDQRHLDSIKFQILSGLLHLIDHGCLHSDIKPDNMLYELIEGLIQVYLSDFGGARFVDELNSDEDLLEFIASEHYLPDEMERLIQELAHALPKETRGLMSQRQVLLREFNMTRPSEPEHLELQSTLMAIQRQLANCPVLQHYIKARHLHDIYATVSTLWQLTEPNDPDVKLLASWIDALTEDNFGNGYCVLVTEIRRIVKRLSDLGC